MRVAVKPSLLRWSRERAGLTQEDLVGRFPRLPAWEAGDVLPTLKQLEGFANATHTAIGYLFLPEPPHEAVPIADFRTAGNKRIGHPSPDLLETIYICQQRQEWYRDFERTQQERPLPFVGSVSLKDDAVETAAKIRNALGFDLAERRRCATWTDALRRFIDQADSLGVLVMVNGVVGNNNYRRLDPDEFRGFALSDNLAPLVFINGADTKAGQMFTLAHEIVHLWLGETALSDVGPATTTANAVELWCNKVAAELLVPLDEFKEHYRKGEDITGALARLARQFKVSTLVILRRIFDAGGLTKEQFWQEYELEVGRLRNIPRGSGGDFYLTQAARVGKRFARALVTSTLEGQTLHRDAFQLLGFSKLSTFRELGHSLGVM